MCETCKRVIEELENIIKLVESDERFGYEPATVQVNAPLALIQTVLETQHRTARQLLAVATKGDMATQHRTARKGGRS